MGGGACGVENVECLKSAAVCVCVCGEDSRHINFASCH